MIPTWDQLGPIVQFCIQAAIGSIAVTTAVAAPWAGFAILGSLYGMEKKNATHRTKP